MPIHPEGVDTSQQEDNDSQRGVDSAGDVMTEPQLAKEASLASDPTPLESAKTVTQLKPAKSGSSPQSAQTGSSPHCAKTGASGDVTPDVMQTCGRTTPAEDDVDMNGEQDQEASTVRDETDSADKKETQDSGSRDTPRTSLDSEGKASDRSSPNSYSSSFLRYLDERSLVLKCGADFEDLLHKKPVVVLERLLPEALAGRVSPAQLPASQSSGKKRKSTGAVNGVSSGSCSPVPVAPNENRHAKTNRTKRRKTRPLKVKEGRFDASSVASVSRASSLTSDANEARQHCDLLDPRVASMSKPLQLACRKGQTADQIAFKKRPSVKIAPESRAAHVRPAPKLSHPFNIEKLRKKLKVLGHRPSKKKPSAQTYTTVNQGALKMTFVSTTSGFSVSSDDVSETGNNADPAAREPPMDDWESRPDAIFDCVSQEGGYSPSHKDRAKLAVPSSSVKQKPVSGFPDDVSQNNSASDGDLITPPSRLANPSHSNTSTSIAGDAKSASRDPPSCFEDKDSARDKHRPFSHRVHDSQLIHTGGGRGERTESRAGAGRGRDERTKSIGVVGRGGGGRTSSIWGVGRGRELRTNGVIGGVRGGDERTRGRVGIEKGREDRTRIAMGGVGRGKRRTDVTAAPQISTPNNTQLSKNSWQRPSLMESPFNHPAPSSTLKSISETDMAAVNLPSQAPARGPSADTRWGASRFVDNSNTPRASSSLSVARCAIPADAGWRPPQAGRRDREGWSRTGPVTPATSTLSQSEPGLLRHRHSSQPWLVASSQPNAAQYSRSVPVYPTQARPVPQNQSAPFHSSQPAAVHSSHSTLVYSSPFSSFGTPDMASAWSKNGINSSARERGISADLTVSASLSVHHERDDTTGVGETSADVDSDLVAMRNYYYNTLRQTGTSSDSYDVISEPSFAEPTPTTAEPVASGPDIAEPFDSAQQAGESVSSLSTHPEHAEEEIPALTRPTVQSPAITVVVQGEGEETDDARDGLSNQSHLSTAGIVMVNAQATPFTTVLPVSSPGRHTASLLQSNGEQTRAHYKDVDLSTVPVEVPHVYPSEFLTVQGTGPPHAAVLIKRSASCGEMEGGGELNRLGFLHGMGTDPCEDMTHLLGGTCLQQGQVVSRVKICQEEEGEEGRDEVFTIYNDRDVSQDAFLSLMGGPSLSGAGADTETGGDPISDVTPALRDNAVADSEDSDATLPYPPEERPDSASATESRRKRSSKGSKTGQNKAAKVAPARKTYPKRPNAVPSTRLIDLPLSQAAQRSRQRVRNTQRHTLFKKRATSHRPKDGAKNSSMAKSRLEDSDSLSAADSKSRASGTGSELADDTLSCADSKAPTSVASSPCQPIDRKRNVDFPKSSSPSSLPSPSKTAAHSGSCEGQTDSGGGLRASTTAEACEQKDTPPTQNRPGLSSQDEKVPSQEKLLSQDARGTISEVSAPEKKADGSSLDRREWKPVPTPLKTGRRRPRGGRRGQRGRRRVTSARRRTPSDGRGAAAMPEEDSGKFVCQ